MKYGHYQMVVRSTVINAGEDDESTILDRTWNDIKNAFDMGIQVNNISVGDEQSEIAPLVMIGTDENDGYVLAFGDVYFMTDSPDGFPVMAT